MTSSAALAIAAVRVDRRYRTVPSTFAPLPQLLGRVSVKNTFIEVQEEQELEKQELRRSKTEPLLASWCGSDDSSQEESAEEQESDEEQDSEEEREPDEASASQESAEDHDLTQEQDSAKEQAPDEVTGFADKFLAHRLGRCRPCSYYWLKDDGCRMGDACTFCHICTAEEVKGKKRTTKKELRAQKRKDEAISRVTVSSTLRCQLPLGRMLFRRPVASSEQAS
eukprot:TRINITY_DN15827_c0_g1_i1.p1 TRINITY_DN15827_c0_g1~~TRINITY_DN15827_c0_g1_i1.p1  ORF type:complete len:224 (-),score=45.90 TRINITY_DN15827_c0_g1_i1:611-1282(-)